MRAKEGKERGREEKKGLIGDGQRGIKGRTGVNRRIRGKERGRKERKVLIGEGQESIEGRTGVKQEDERIGGREGRMEGRRNEGSEEG